MKRKASLLGIAVLSTSILMGNHFDTVYSIGDSLSDAGTYYQDINLLLPVLGGNYTSTSRFTVNPGFTHPMFLAQKFGLVSFSNQLNNFTTPDIFLGGPNFAEGAAGVVATYQPIPGVNLDALSMVNQFSALMSQTNGKISPNAIVTVLGGDNDIQNGFPNFPSDQYVITAADALGEIVQKLKNAGSKHTVAFLAIDPSQTPKAHASTQAVRDRLSYLTSVFNDNFVEAIEGANAVVVDSNRITYALLANPVKYGFANINHLTDYATLHANLPAGINPTVGGSSLFLVQDQNLFIDGNQFIFADSVHPSPRTHQIIADTVYSVLRAPGFAAAIPNAAMANSLQFLHNINSNLYSWQQLSCQDQGLCKNEMSYYLSYELSDFKINSDTYFIAPHSDNLMNGFLLGGNYYFTPSLLIGSVFNYQNTLGKVHGNRGHYRLNQYSLGVYAQGSFLCNWVGYISLLGGYISGDSVRKDQVGVTNLKAYGDLRGQTWATEAGLRYQLRKGRWVSGPNLSYLYDYVRTNTFSESGDFTALKFKSMHTSTSRIHLGWDTEYGSSCYWLRPFLQFGYDFQLGTDHFWGNYGMIMYTKVKLDNVFNDSFNANAGVKYEVNDLINVTLQGGYNWFWTTSYIGNFNLAIECKW
jgi:outer membrane autotransporter protein